MDKTKTNKAVVAGFVALMVLGLAGYALFAESAKEKTEVAPIGSLSVHLVPNASAGSAEYFRVTFNAPGEWDFSGWTLSNSAGFEYEFDVEPIGQGDMITFCGVDAAGLNCDYIWGSSDDFPDVDGDYIFTDLNGNVISTKPYGDLGAGGKVGDAPDFITTVFSSNAQVTLCKDAQQGYTTQKVNVSNIIGGRGPVTPGSIVPSFYYAEGAGVLYYSGQNWPDETGVYANGCS